jgi:hypothetical protein
MNIKRYFISVAAVFAAMIVLDFLIHSVILMGTYASIKDLWRPDMMSYIWIMYVTQLGLSFLFVFVFTKGYENRGILEGVRYGLIMGVMIDGIGALGQFIVYPIPTSLAAQWFVYGITRFIVLGMVVALIYRPKNT